MIPLPDKEAINNLEPFVGLGLGEIQVVITEQQAQAALAELKAGGVVGFDTESKPTFHVGQQSQGPHVVQLATGQKAWVFQVQEPASYATLQAILEAEAITKVGFGLGSDIAHIVRRFGVQPRGIVDLNARFSALGYRKTIGARQAIAMLFGKRFIKSKSISTSNWASRTLTERQILYAANDAYAAIRVYQAMGTQEVQARFGRHPHR
jgi:ribonuclease D